MSLESAATLQMLEDIPTSDVIHIESDYGSPVALCGVLCGGEETIVPDEEVTDASVCGECEYHDIELRKQGL